MEVSDVVSNPDDGLDPVQAVSNMAEHNSRDSVGSERRAEVFLVIVVSPYFRECFLRCGIPVGRCYIFRIRIIRW